MSPFLRALTLALLALPPGAAAQPVPEVQLAMQSLRAGERDRLFKASGPIEEATLYRADLEIDADKRTVAGKLAITFVPRDKPADTLDLRVTPNAKEIRVRLFAAVAGGRPAVLEQPEPSLVRVRFLEPAPRGVATTVELKLSATLPEAPKNSDALTADPSSLNARGGDHGAFMAAPEVINLAGVVPGIPPLIIDGAPEAGPSGIGDLGLFAPAHYLVTVLAPRGWTAVAGGVSLGEVPEKDGRTRYSFGLSAARDFGLFLTRGYQVQVDNVDGVALESHVFPADKEAGGRVLRYARQALVELQKRLGPYPWTTFRIVETRLAGGAGGMEFPALIAISTGLYRGAADPLEALGMPGLGQLPMLSSLLGDLKPMMESTLEFTVAHEVAHQWFPMMVGSDPIDEPVVDEALAQHVALLYLEWKHGRKTADGMRDAQLKLAYQFHRLTGGGDGAALRSTREFGTTGEYAALVYGKAPLLFDQQRKLMGDGPYLAGLKQYVEVFRWRWARPPSLTEVLAKKSPKNARTLEELRRRYWQEEHGDDDVGQSGLFGNLGLVDPTAKGALQLGQDQQQMLEQIMKALQGMDQE